MCGVRKRLETGAPIAGLGLVDVVEIVRHDQRDPGLGREPEELLVEHPYTYTEEDIAFELYAVLHEIPKVIWPAERKKFLSKSHPHLRVSALAKRYGWGVHNNTDGKIALIAVESAQYKQLMNDPRTTKIKAFRSTRA